MQHFNSVIYNEVTYKATIVLHCVFVCSISVCFFYRYSYFMFNNTVWYVKLFRSRTNERNWICRAHSEQAVTAHVCLRD